jgi:hypothetical protein
MNQSNINAPLLEGLHIEQTAKKNKIRKDAVVG